MISLEKLTLVKDPVSLEKDLQGKDLIVLLDISGSMQTSETSGGVFGIGGKTETRIEMAKTLIQAHYELFKQYSGKETVSFILFDNRVTYYEVSNKAELDALLDKTVTGGTTNTAGALELAFSKVGKEAVVLVYTDGEPSNRDAVVRTIKQKATSGVDPDKFGIMFAQVGSDAGALSFLKYLVESLA
jgi:uncharacterized protein with von Willebrand factor type A (vWA) domain